MPQIGFPVLTVTEMPEGIRVRQDRFLETGKGQGADNETIWLVYPYIFLMNELFFTEFVGMFPWGSWLSTLPEKRWLTVRSSSLNGNNSSRLTLVNPTRWMLVLLESVSEGRGRFEWIRSLTDLIALRSCAIWAQDDGQDCRRGCQRGFSVFTEWSYGSCLWCGIVVESWTRRG